MSDKIRATVGVPAGAVWLKRRAVLPGIAAMAPTAATAAVPAAAAEDNSVSAFLSAALALDRYEIAALALTLGVIFFATLTAILLVRTRARAERMEAEARVEIMALKAEVDRAKALLLSEPQVIVVWPASGEEPEILGDS